MNKSALIPFFANIPPVPAGAAMRYGLLSDARASLDKDAGR